MTKFVTRIAFVAVVALALVAGASSVDAAFTRDLTIGSQGADVVELQTVLENQGYLVMPAGVAKGYFGQLTKNAVIKWQAAVGLPSTGYFGPLSRASIASSGAASGNAGGVPSGNPNTPSGGLGDGEASLESFEFSSGNDDDIEEDAAGEVAEIEFDVEDGDVRVNRIDLTLVGSGEETDPWDAFDTLTLTADGKEIGEVDLSDEDEYLDEDEGTVRISGLDYVVRDGETATIVVEITAQSGVDGVEDNDASWTINVEDDGIRATDGEGIEQYIGDADETVSFDIVEEGQDDELNVSSSDADPDAETFKIEDDEKSDWFDVFAFDIESEESDVEFDSVVVAIDTSTTTNIMIDDLILEIDGEEFDDWDYVGTATGSTTINVEFDIDGDYTLGADEEVTAVVKAKFKAANVAGHFSATTTNTIEVSIADEAIDGEASDDILSDGTATGNEHTLSTAGIVIMESSFQDEGSSENNDEGTSRDYTFTFEVSAFEEDFYIATSSVNVFVDGPAAATSSYTVSSTGDEDTTNVFTVEEGETETFTVVVTISDVASTGQYRVGLDSVDYTENSNGISSLSNKDVDNTDFRTAYRTVNQ